MYIYKHNTYICYDIYIVPILYSYRCILVYIYIYTDVCIYIYICIHIYIYICIHIYIYMYVFVCIYICIYIQLNPTWNYRILFQFPLELSSCCCPTLFLSEECNLELFWLYNIDQQHEPVFWFTC